MDIEVKVDPEHVEKCVSEAIVKSAIGGHIKKALEDILKSESWNNPFRSAVSSEVHRTIVKLVEDDYSDRIRIMVRKQMTEAVLNDVINKAMKAWIAAR